MHPYGHVHRYVVREPRQRQTTLFGVHTTAEPREGAWLPPPGIFLNPNPVQRSRSVQLDLRQCWNLDT